MEKLNLVKILKDCPKGTKLYSPALGECALEGVNDNNDYPIKVTYKIINNDTRFDYFTKYGYLLINKTDAECMLFPSKNQRDWSKWQRPFVKGDILVSEKGNIVLCSHIDEEQVVHFHCILNFQGNFEIYNGTGVGYSYNCNLANDSQKQRLFDALKKEGYEWDEEKKELKTLQPFKDGDILVYKNKSININYTFIYKYRIDMHYLSQYCGWFSEKPLLAKQFNVMKRMPLYENDDIRFATEEEKDKLFAAIKANGYKWNDKNKTLEKLIEPKFKVGDKIRHKLTGNVYKILFVLSNGCGGGVYNVAITNEIGKSIDVKEQDDYELVPNKFDITTLKPFDKVLVRDNNNSIWVNAFFGFYDIEITKKYTFVASVINWTQCIPYEGNEHLLGTYEDCDEYYKNW